jgi:dipeptidyl aminopeptidase/acylaminoacyl peptidase
MSTQGVSRLLPAPTAGTALLAVLTLLLAPSLHGAPRNQHQMRNPVPFSDPGSLVSPQRPTAPPIDPGVIEKIPIIEDVSWSPDGRQVVYTSTASGRQNVWVTDVDSLKSRSVAPSQDDQSSPQWGPDGKQVLFLADRAGDELYDVFVADVASGQVRNVTSSPERSERFATWSPDGRQIAYSSRERNAEGYSIAVIDVKDGKQRTLAETHADGHTLMAPFWSPQGDWIYYHDQKWSRDQMTILRMRTDGRDRTEMTPHGSAGQYTIAAVSPDGRTLLIRATAENGWQNIATVDVETRRIKWITNDAATFNAGGFSPDGNIVAFTRDVGIATHVYLYDRAKRTTRALQQQPGIRELVLDGPIPLRQNRSPFSPDGSALLYTRESSTVAPEALSSRLSDGIETTLVAARVPGTITATLTEAVDVQFPSTDGKFVLHANVWMPANITRNESHPAVVMIHGGPNLQSRARFRPTTQTLVSNGYIVISPNFRGSTGYDFNLFRGNMMDWGGGDLADVNAAADWVARSGFVDSRRIAAYGASFGGYLTLMALATAPGRWAAGAALFPLTDLEMAYSGAVPWLRAYNRMYMGTPDKNRELWRARSPLRLADRIRAPLLMTAGANDVRCPPEQARQMEQAIRTHGGTVELTVFGEQGHGSADIATYEDEDTRVLRFLNRYVRDVRLAAREPGFGHFDDRAGAPGRQALLQ